MKTKKKFLVSILAILMVCIILQPNKANAALQSNGDKSATKTRNKWIVEIRQMQELGGTLGRTDIVNTTNLTSNATDLDIHMEKNTEYGAMAILSASAYGNPNKINDGETTTGNSTGIVVNMKFGESVAVYTSKPSKLDLSERYINLYAINYAEKTGDAILETLNWHSPKSNSIWLDHVTDNTSAVERRLIRGLRGSIFSYTGNYRDGGYDGAHASRAVIVVGTGI